MSFHNLSLFTLRMLSIAAIASRRRDGQVPVFRAQHKVRRVKVCRVAIACGRVGKRYPSVLHTTWGEWYWQLEVVTGDNHLHGHVHTFESRRMARR